MIGKILGNRYEIVCKIGEGGMSCVYKAKDKLLNRFVAVKILRDELVSDDEFIKQFEQESQAAASLSHGNIVNVYDVGAEEDLNYIVMELVTGPNLKAYLKEHGELTNDELLKISKSIASAIEHAHSNGIIHRDIKPHNILISESGAIKVADFGIAKAVSSATRVNNNEVIGSVHYSSPEQSRGKYVDEKTDIYSLGIVMYELATKKLPFDGDSPVAIALKHMKEEVVPPTTHNANLNKGIESIILKAIQKDTASRYQKIKDLIDDLDVIISYPNENVAFYEYNAESATQKMPTLDELFDETQADEVEKTKPKNKVNKPKKETRKKQGKQLNKMAVLTVILLALVFSLTIFAVVWLNNQMNGNTVIEKAQIPAPMLIGKTQTEAEATLAELNLKSEVASEAFSDDYEQGIVISQSVDEGYVIKEGSIIQLVISKGIIKTKVPNVVNKMVDEAKMTIENNKFVVGETKYEFSEFLPQGFVISQSPVAKLEVKEKTVIDLVVSSGPENKMILVPTMENYTLEQASPMLKDLSLFIGDITNEFSDTVEEGKIIKQSVKSNSEVKPNTVINFVVSKGPEFPDQVTEPTTEPGTDTETPVDNTDSGTTTPTQELKSKEINFYFNFDEGVDEENVKVVVIQNGIPNVVYDKKHKRSEIGTTVNIKGLGTVEVKVYFGDKEYSSQTIEIQ